MSEAVDNPGWSQSASEAGPERPAPEEQERET